MAKYDHLPIFKKSYDLCLEIEKQVNNFSRDYKYTIGTEIRQISHEIPALIMNAFGDGKIKEKFSENTKS